MICRKKFRLSLYKMMLLRNIIENKQHKEKMTMLYAFEQLIINTEDGNPGEYYYDDEEEEDDGVYGEEDFI
jgi:hypothetical protein